MFSPAAFDAGARQPSIVLVQGEGEPLSFRASDVSGPSGQPLPMKIDILAPEKNLSQLFIFSGLPKGVTLQPGGKFRDFWAVNAGVIDEVTLTAPPGFSGSFTVWITRGSDQSSNAQSVPITVVIGGPATTPTASAVTGVIPGSPSEPKPRAGGGLANEAMLIARAKASFDKGDVSGARAIYEYLAMQGSPAAAMAMGETFDPLVLAMLVVKGLEADAKKAKFWYQKAEQLGSREARGRLNALAAR